MCFHVKGLKASVVHKYLHLPSWRQWGQEGRDETATLHVNYLCHGVRITPKCVSSTLALLTATVFTACLKMTTLPSIFWASSSVPWRRTWTLATHLSLQELSQPGRTETSQATSSGMLCTLGQDHRCKEKWWISWKWCCLCHVLKGMGERGLVLDRNNISTHIHKQNVRETMTQLRNYTALYNRSIDYRMSFCLILIFT